MRAMTAVGILFIGLLGAGEAVGAGTTPAFCTNPIRLMPLGDSITMGKYSGQDISNGVEHDDIGYRKELKDLLVTAGYDVDFVGTLSNGHDPPDYPLLDQEHEGHPGAEDIYIANNVSSWLNLGPPLPPTDQTQPDVILLHIGTNSPRDPIQVSYILDEINSYETAKGSSVIVVLARIIEKKDFESVIHNYNNAVQAIVEARPDYGSELFMVDMEDGAGFIYTTYPAGDMLPDGIHPYATGYTKMAKVWMRKIDEICGNLPQLVNPGDQISEEGDNISLELITNGSDIYSLTYSQSGLPPGLSTNSSTGRISGTISNGAQSGSPYDVTVTLSYDYGELDQVNFTWIVYKIRDIYLPILVKR